MKIPRIPAPGGFTGKAWSSGDNGKGSAPRNVSDQFRANFDGINWGPRLPKSENGHTRITHRNGEKIVETNGSGTT